ncbi:hypothetical protein O9993_14130 [Vibrio lentus]|nr:hypothetical protein [Vibrio lentus]
MTKAEALIGSEKNGRELPYRSVEQYNKINKDEITLIEESPVPTRKHPFANQVNGNQLKTLEARRINIRLRARIFIQPYSA